MHASILERSVAFSRFKVFEAVVKHHGASFVVRDHLNVIGDVSSNESCEMLSVILITSYRQCEYILSQSGSISASGLWLCPRIKNADSL